MWCSVMISTQLDVSKQFKQKFNLLFSSSATLHTNTQYDKKHTPYAYTVVARIDANTTINI